MPGFVKTPRDESRWAKAKEAAGKQTEKDSESYYKLSNYIYHKMGKSEEDQKLAELYKGEITNSFKSGKELNIENIRSFLMNDQANIVPAQQSIVGNEVGQMSEEKKYTAKEAAIAVLKKAEEVLKKSEVIKKHQHIGWDKLHSKLEHEGYSKESADKIAGSVKAKVNKSEPVGEIHPKEPQAGESEKPGDRVHQQAAPDKNPKEQAEGNNELAGTTPTQVGQDGKNLPGFDEMRGHIKLAKFIGHMQAKRKLKNPAGAM